MKGLLNKHALPALRPRLMLSVDRRMGDRAHHMIRLVRRVLRRALLTLSEPAEDCSPTYLMVRGRPVFFSSRVFDRVVGGIYPDATAQGRARVSARMVSDSTDIRKRRRAEWRKFKNWLEQRHDEAKDRFEKEWAQFHFEGADAAAEVRDLLVAWSDFSGIGVAGSFKGHVGVASVRGKTSFAGLHRDAVVEITGTLDNFSGRTSRGSEFHATSTCFKVLGA